MPYHQDLPVDMLTRLSTKLVNRYHYLQLRQCSLHSITPVHTIAEYAKFKQHIHDTQICQNTKKIYPTYEAHKMIDFDKFAVFWNSEVKKQDHTKVDSNKHLYYKLPSQLKQHHKRILAWKSEHSTLLMGGNAAALKPFCNLLTNDNTTTTLPAQLPPEILAASGKSNTHLFCLISTYCCLKQNLSRIKQIAVKESFLRIRKFAWNK